MMMDWVLSASVLTAAVLLRLLFRRRISQRRKYWLWLPVLTLLLTALTVGCAFAGRPETPQTPQASPGSAVTPAASPETKPQASPSPAPGADGDGSASTPEPSPEPTAEPTPEPTPSPEPTPEPTPSPEPTPEVPPTPGPWEPLTEEMGDRWLTPGPGERKLTAEELAEWDALFDEYWMLPQFLCSAYERPEDVDLEALFYNGVDFRWEDRTAYVVSGRNEVTEEDVSACLRRMGSWITETDTDKLPRSEVDAVLREWLGLGLDETSRVNFYFPYIPETDCFYHPHGDTNAGGFRGFLFGCERGEEIDLYYSGNCPYYGEEFPLGFTYRSGVYRLRLRREGELKRFVSNQRMLTNGVEAVAEAPMPGPSFPADYSSDFGADVTVLTPEPEVFGSFEEAVEATENMEYKTDNPDVPEEEETLLGVMSITWRQDLPGYGALLYGEIAAGLPHGNLTCLFFITPDGRRYSLPRPLAGFSEMPLDTSDRRYTEAEEGRAVCLDPSAPDMIRYWTYCRYETNPAPGILPKERGFLNYSVYLPTMEVFILFSPDE